MPSELPNRWITLSFVYSQKQIWINYLDDQGRRYQFSDERPEETWKTVDIQLSDPGASIPLNWPAVLAERLTEALGDLQPRFIDYAEARPSLLPIFVHLKSELRSELTDKVIADWLRSLSAPDRLVLVQQSERKIRNRTPFRLPLKIAAVEPPDWGDIVKLSLKGERL